MTIETNYNIGDEVWYVDKSVKHRTIDAIKVEQKRRGMGWIGEPTINYRVGCEWWPESKLFPTKEELINSL